jgi:cytochrome c556
MKGRVKRVVRMALVSAVVVASCLHSGSSFGHENHPTHMPDPQQAVPFREYLMENIGANAKEMKGKIDAGTLKEAKMNAAAIALHSTRIAGLFPEGSTSDSSRAKEEIWQNWDAFLASATELSTEADALAVAAGENNAAAVKEHMQKMFGTCKGCHDQFRKPE